MTGPAREAPGTAWRRIVNVAACSRCRGVLGDVHGWATFGQLYEDGTMRVEGYCHRCAADLLDLLRGFLSSPRPKKEQP